MPTSLPPLPDEITDNTDEVESAGKRQTNDVPSAFGGGMPPAMEAARMIEQGYKMLAMAMPSAVPMAAQAISQLRMMMSAPPPGADAGAPPPGGPAGPAITGAVQNPVTLPPPPQGM